MPIHKVIKGCFGEYVYLCNQAVHALTKKSSLRWNKVTCKNCLKIKKRNQK